MRISFCNASSQSSSGHSVINVAFTLEFESGERVFDTVEVINLIASALQGRQASGGDYSADEDDTATPAAHPSTQAPTQPAARRGRPPKAKATEVQDTPVQPAAQPPTQPEPTQAELPFQPAQAAPEPAPPTPTPVQVVPAQAPATPAPVQTAATTPASGDMIAGLFATPAQPAAQAPAQPAGGGVDPSVLRALLDTYIAQHPGIATPLSAKALGELTRPLIEGNDPAVMAEQVTAALQGNAALFPEIAQYTTQMMRASLPRLFTSLWTTR